MAIRPPEELIEMIKKHIGEDVSDEAIAILEDATDTLSDMARRVTEAGDWETRYQENDAQWRRRYRERFENAPEVEIPDDTVEFVPGEVETVVDEPGEEPKTYADLFTTEG